MCFLTNTKTRTGPPLPVLRLWQVLRMGVALMVRGRCIRVGVGRCLSPASRGSPIRSVGGVWQASFGNAAVPEAGLATPGLSSNLRICVVSRITDQWIARLAP
jgi:hypothetical protein